MAKAGPAEHAGRYEDVMARNAWWREARFGMFIHFGAYAVMTAKHHDGFCLFDSALTDYKNTPRFGGRDLVRAYMHGQVEELVTRYGRLDVLWLDYSFDDYRGEKWGAERLVATVRRHQPGILINKRLGVGTGVAGGARDLGPWGITLNNNWGYHAGDHEWKPPGLVVHTLVEAVSKNGNLLLNVGPDARGLVPGPSVRILEEVGRWMDRNRESVYGAGAADLPRPEWGRFTRRGGATRARATSS